MFGHCIVGELGIEERLKKNSAESEKWKTQR
jgi:hypothetical protein